MKIESLLRVQSAGEGPTPRAPRVILYIPPSGKAIHGNELETARRTAELYAASHPGHTVAIYELVGYAYKPVTPAEFTTANSEKAAQELLPYPDEDLPEDKFTSPPEGDDEPDRPDLTPEQRETLQKLRDIQRSA